MSEKTVLIYLGSAQKSGGCRRGGFRAAFVQCFPGISRIHSSSCVRGYTYNAPGLGILTTVTHHRPIGGGKSDGGNQEFKAEVSTPHANARKARAAAQTLWSALQMLWSAPQKLWSAARKLCPAPQKLWSAARKLCLAAQMLYPAPQMLWSPAQKLYPAPQMLWSAPRMCYPAPQMCYRAVRICSLAAEMSFNAAQMFFIAARNYSTPAPVLYKYMPIRRGQPYPFGFSVSPRQK